MSELTDTKPRHEFELRSDTSGATGAHVWSASRVLADVLEERFRKSPTPRLKQTILELGCGTGYLAMRLASAARGTQVIATDVPHMMRNVKYNVNRNRLGHAISSVPWDWRDEQPPPGIKWQEVTQCVVADAVYYDETGDAEAALARSLATVVTRCRRGVEVLLMLRVRVLQHDTDADGVRTESTSTLTPSDSYDSRSTVYSFIERALPRVGLRAELLPLAEHNLGAHLGGCPHHATGLRLYSIIPSAALVCIATAPVLETLETRQALGLQHEAAWRRQRDFIEAGLLVGTPPAAPPASAPLASTWSWRYELEVMPACDSAEMPLQQLFDLITSGEALADRGTETWPGAWTDRVSWAGWRQAGGFFGVQLLVLIARVDGSTSSSSLVDRLGGCGHVQSARLLSATSQTVDAFATCAAIARPGAIPMSMCHSRLPLRSGLTSANVRELLGHGYTIVDDFLAPAAVHALSLLTRQSLAAYAGHHEDGIPWREPEPRHARSDISTWVNDGSRPATDAAFCATGGVLPALDRLQSDLHLFLRLRGVRELQLSSYAPGGRGYRGHTDATPECDIGGSQRKITAITYSNADWKQADGGELRLWLADHDGMAVVDVEPRGGRLLLFLSGCMMHQVMPTHASAPPRVAVTAWYH